MTNPQTPVSLPMRLWMATPDWVFRVIGAGLFIAYLGSRLPEYFDFPECGPFMTPVEDWDQFGRPVFGQRVYFPLANVLVDLTFLLIALAFCFRLPPRHRAASGREIVIPLIAAVWPLLPFLLPDILRAARSGTAGTLSAMLDFGEISYPRFYAGVALLCVGNGLDVWGYGTLFRSVSITAEARELKVTGPYRLVRHPVYLGQFIAQAGAWLVLRPWQLTWIAFYLLFVFMQLYRSRVEDRVLERAFGERYLAWKHKTFWFV